jgi:hypothetical protein
MSFSSFCILNEGLNLGETMEGIFAIAVGAYIANGKLDVDTINNIRSSSSFSGGKGKVAIQSNISSNANLIGIQADPEDKITVSVEINLRSKNVDGMFGDDLDPNTKVDALVASVVNKVPNLSTIKKIHSFIVDILTNNKPDDIEFVVVADGSGASAAKGGFIKGDVKLDIHARTKTSIPQEIKGTLSFSLKTGEDAKTVSNLSIFGGILKMGQHYNLEFVEGISKDIEFTGKYKDTQKLVYDHPDKWTDEEHFISYLRKYLLIQDSFLSKKDDEFEGGGAERRVQQMTAELTHLKTLLKKFIEAFTRDIKGIDSDVFTAEPHARLFASKTFDFIQREIFGTDIAEYIHVTDSDIKEIKKADIENMKYEYVVKVESEPNGIVNFTGINIDGSKKLIFRIVPRLEYNIKTQRKTQLLTIDIGDLA